MRIGQGFDLHRLVKGRNLIIGGVEVPSEVGEAAHSDGDVLIHAIIDALLGTEALGDIGTYFPPSDMKWKDSDSKDLLKETLTLTKRKLINLDSTIILQRPKLGPYILQIRESLASLLNTDISNISVKAKTAEHILGELGRGEAIIAEVSLLVE